MNVSAFRHAFVRQRIAVPARLRAWTPPIRRSLASEARSSFSSSVSQADPTSKQKPKASTPLRRSANASLPIRSNPTPTRGDIQQVTTLATAERFILPRLRGYLPRHAQPLGDAWWVPRWGDKGNEGEVFIFGNGSFVCWGMGEGDARKFASQIITRSRVEVGVLKEPETEELDFCVDPKESTRLQGDLIILGHSPPLSDTHTLPPPASLAVAAFPEDTLLARYAFSQALSRSTALSALEVSLDEYLSSVALLPDSLARTGKPGMTRKAVIQKLGLLLKFRQGLNLNRENFSDTPDFYWAEPVLEGYFNSVSAALEVRARTRSVNDKITYAAEVQSTLRQLLTESSTHRMELVIIALIAVEVVLALIREGPDLLEMVTGKKDEEKELVLS